MWKQQLVILIGLVVIFLPLLVRKRAVQKWWLIGVGALGGAAAVAQLFGFPPVHHDRTTTVIGAMGLLCLLIGSRWYGREGWHRLNLTLPQTYQGYRDGTLRRPATWENALQFLGLGLLALSWWRQWSGLP